MFWRTFLAIFLHYLAILATASMSLKLGWFHQRVVETKIEDILERPPEDSATMFSFVKQAFYHRTLAYTKFEKSKKLRKSKAV